MTRGAVAVVAAAGLLECAAVTGVLFVAYLATGVEALGWSTVAAGSVGVAFGAAGIWATS